MVIDFGDSPLRKPLTDRNGSLPGLKDGAAGEDIDGCDLHDKVIRMATEKSLGFAKIGNNKLSKSCRRLKTARSNMTGNAIYETVDDADVASAKRLFHDYRKNRSVSDDEDVDKICSRNFNLNTPDFEQRKVGRKEMNKKNRRQNKKKHARNPFLSATYRNGNIASPSASLQWMVPQRRVPRNQNPLTVSKNNSPSVKWTGTSSSSSTPIRGKNRTPSSPKAQNHSFTRPSPKPRFFPTALRGRITPKTPKEKLSKHPATFGKNVNICVPADRKILPNLKSGEASPTTPSTPGAGSVSDFENESIATSRSPELELVCMNEDGLSFCVQTLQKLSPISKDVPKSTKIWSKSPSFSSMEMEHSRSFDSMNTPSQSPSEVNRHAEAKGYDSFPDIPKQSLGGSFEDSYKLPEARSSKMQDVNGSFPTDATAELSWSFETPVVTPARGNRSGLNSNNVNSATDTKLMSSSSKPPLHSRNNNSVHHPYSILDTLLSPDPRAFEIRNNVTRSPAACPPTPVSRPRMSRSTSLGQTKLLASTDHAKVPGLKSAKKISRIFYSKKVVGEGSFFKVYKVYMKDEGGKLKAYALKTSKRTFRSKNDRAMYLREVELVKSIPLHPNIVKYVAAWQEELHFYVVMEYCRCTLEKLVSMVKTTDKFLWNVLYQVSRALQHIHQHDTLHLDVKPVNVLYGIDKVLKLADFGQAISTKRVSQMLDGCEGDSKYMAPELMKNNAIPTEAADVFSLGLLMVEIITRKTLPSEGPKWQDLRKGRARGHLLGRVGRKLESIVLRMLDPNPPGRPSAAQVAETSMEVLKRGHW
eukprot:CAMPEP_0184502892 /NCGR_PEP_ID=MMETSP0113_2-20130426/51474_1 /TAXON_ID=91329 /ORGANISM="Norrisiella sphaerica, Strain BC52" /LENGTH=812 /DNA_ID=CAMNT_0026892261 /DNA_START=15 /DNA_END=2453 /DNA_ORIENTATION=-